MPMRKDANASTAMNAIAYMLEETFDRDDWVRLGMETECVDEILDHSRLLRSLSFGDDDYLACILGVLPTVLDQHDHGGPTRATVGTLRNLGAVEEHLGLEKWLQENKPELHRKLYAGTGTHYIDDLINAVPDPLTVADIEDHARRIRAGLIDDPAQAVGSAKELLETVLKSILGLHGTGKETKIDLPKLVGSAMDHLGLSPSGVRSADPGAAQRKRLLGSLSTIVTAAAELRNAGLGTGHGVSRRPQLDPATARLAVSAAISAATFFVEIAGSGAAPSQHVGAASGK